MFSVESTRELIGKADASDNTLNLRDESVVVPYRAVTEGLAAAAVPYDVVIWSDGVTEPDRASAEALQRYSTVLLPDVFALTEAQGVALEGYLAQGGTVVVTDRTAPGLPRHERVVSADRSSIDQLLPHGRQVDTTAPVSSNVQRLADGSFAVHLVNYDYDREADAVRPIDDVPLRVRVAASGVCASELEPWVDGPADGEARYLGHEVSGAVVDAGVGVTTLAAGDRVGVWVTERGFAEYVAVGADHCFASGDGPPDLALAEPIACATNAVQAVGMKLHAAGPLPLDDLVTHRFGLEQINDAFATLRDKPDGFVKAVITFPEA